MKLILSALFSTAMASAAIQQHVPATNCTVKPHSGMLLDQFQASDLEFGDWLEEMASGGDVFLPMLSERSVAIARQEEGEDWYVTIKNAGCAQVTGNAETIEKTREHFCNEFVVGAAKIYATTMETDVSNLLCNGRVCKLGVRASMNFFKIYTFVSDVTGWCNQMFDKLNEACPEGGVAEVEIGDNNGYTESSQIESTYNLQDDEVCEETNTQECFERQPPS